MCGAYVLDVRGCTCSMSHSSVWFTETKEIEERAEYELCSLMEAVLPTLPKVGYTVHM